MAKRIKRETPGQMIRRLATEARVARALSSLMRPCFEKADEEKARRAQERGYGYCKGSAAK